MTPRQLRRKIALLPSPAPITEKFDATLARLGQHHQNEWWDNHQQHWLGWLKEYDGPGHYGRANANRSAQFVYNHVNCPPMLTWLAEASGIDAATIARAVTAALRAETAWPSKCGAIRRVIPWQEISDRLE